MTEAPTPPARTPVGWLVLGLLLLTTVSGIVASFSAKSSASVRVRWLDTLRSALVLRETDVERGRKPSDAWLRSLERQLVAYRKDPVWDAYWIAIRTELREPVSPADAQIAFASKDSTIRDIGKAYLMRPATPLEAEPLARALDGRGVLSRLAATHLREAAKVPGARGWIRAIVDRRTIAAGLYALLGGASVLAWGGLVVAYRLGRLPKLGPPYRAHNLGDADRLAMRAAALFFGFDLVSYLGSVSGLPLPLKTTAVGAAMFVVVPLVLRKSPSFEEAVRFREGFGRKALLGIWAFLLEMPVTMIVALVGSHLFKGLPTNEHPASAELMNTHSLALMASLLFFGAVAAPFWEETMFRGLLFPALRRVFDNPVAAALLSSFVFACIHPQGPGGWLGLMAFALCSCVLVSRTGSLVPSMVMHAAHNGALLTLAILVGN